MPTPTWPPAPFPQKVSTAGYSETPPKLLLENETDVGPPKRRSIATDGYTMINATMELEGFLPTPTTSELQTFKDFYKTTLANGSLPFTWVHPVTGVAATMYIKHMGTSFFAGTTLSISFELKVLP